MGGLRGLNKPISAPEKYAKLCVMLKCLNSLLYSSVKGVTAVIEVCRAWQCVYTLSFTYSLCKTNSD